MAYTTITQTISQFPEAPDSANDTPTEFNTKADAFVNHQANVYVGEVNNWASQANTLKDEINDAVATLPDGSINDDAPSDTTAYSSQKIEAEFRIVSGEEDGTNWTKFPDGTLIMTKLLDEMTTSDPTGNVYRAPDNVTWSFPIAFSVVPYISTISNIAGIWGTLWSPASSTSASVRYYGDSSTRKGMLYATAIGRWK